MREFISNKLWELEQWWIKYNPLLQIPYFRRKEEEIYGKEINSSTCCSRCNEARPRWMGRLELGEVGGPRLQYDKEKYVEFSSLTTIDLWI